MIDMDYKQIARAIGAAIGQRSTVTDDGLKKLNVLRQGTVIEKLEPGNINDLFNEALASMARFRDFMYTQTEDVEAPSVVPESVQAANFIVAGGVEGDDGWSPGEGANQLARLLGNTILDGASAFKGAPASFFVGLMRRFGIGV